MSKRQPKPNPKNADEMLEAAMEQEFTPWQLAIIRKISRRIAAEEVRKMLKLRT